MSNRTLVELNHDYCPADDEAALAAWARQMRYYMGSGDPADLPRGVCWKDMRHHSYPEPTRDSLLERALADALAPLIGKANAQGGIMIGRAARKKAELLAKAALAVVRRVEA